MTPEERAEKILAYTDGSWTYEQAIEKITAELEAYASERVSVSQAIDAACKKCGHAISFYCRECYDGDIRAAVEEATKRVQGWAERSIYEQAKPKPTRKPIKEAINMGFAITGRNRHLRMGRLKWM